MPDSAELFANVILSEAALAAESKDPYALRRHGKPDGSLAVVTFLLLLVVLPMSAQTSDPFAALQARLNAAADAVLTQPSAGVTLSGARPDVGRAESSVPYTDRKDLGITRVAKLRPAVEPLLQREGLPAELAAVVLVESGGNLNALSPRGARGAWQIMPETARRYGLVVTAERDDRLDLFKSTQAAARYLRDLYSQFGNWPLALAAYNAGEGAVERAAARAGSRDFAALSRALPLETRAYVPAVLAAFSVVTPPAATRAASGRVVYARTN